MDENEKRPCSPTESLEKSLGEMRDMRQGKTKKRSWNDISNDLNSGDEKKMKKTSLKNKKIPCNKQIISVQISPATKKINALNRLILELFQ